MTLLFVIWESRAIVRGSAIWKNALDVPSWRFASYEVVLVERGNRISKLSNTFDFDFDDVTGFHEHLRVAAKPDSSRSSRRDHVADFQCHYLRDVRHKFGHFENHVPRVRLLHGRSIQPQFDIQAVAA